MRQSRVRTLGVPALGQKKPTLLTQAGQDEYVRVLVRNNGGNVIFLAYEAQDVSDVTSTGATFQIPTGQSDVLVLAPGQSLFCAALGANGTASVAISDAVPVRDRYLES